MRKDDAPPKGVVYAKRLAGFRTYANHMSRDNRGQEQYSQNAVGVSARPSAYAPGVVHTLLLWTSRRSTGPARALPRAAPHPGSLKAMNSDVKLRPPIATTIYCLPFSI